MSKVRVWPMGFDIEILNKGTLLELLLQNKIEIFHSCGGMGSCGTCRVYVESPMEELPKRNEIENEMAESRGFSDNERLSCQLKPYPNLCVRIPSAIP